MAASFRDNLLITLVLLVFFPIVSFGQFNMNDSLACDTFPPPRNLDGYAQDDAVLLWWQQPLLPDTIGLLNKNVLTINVSKSKSRDTWDLQAVFPCGDASGEYGVETDGNYIYTSKWNAGSGWFFQYELDGTFNGPLTVPGCQDVRDMAYNDFDGLFYGSNASTTIWGINFQTLTVDNTINAPSPCRAIAFDTDYNGFWINNWNTDITLITMSGAIITSFPVNTDYLISGLAYDDWTDGNYPCLWAHDQSGTGCDLIQLDINSGGTPVFTIPVGSIAGGTEIAGGLYTHCGLYESGILTIGGLRRDDIIYAIELTVCDTSIVIGNIVPQNLIGYNVYMDNQLHDYVEYDGNDTTFYWIFNFNWPGCYDYEITTLYDLTPCGSAGDTIESDPCSMITICCGYELILPYVENWETGSFSPNLWDVDGIWEVSPISGYPAPGAMHAYSSDTSYRNGLYSYAINCKDVGMGPYIDGDIFLEFDLKLNDFTQSGTDSLLLQILTDSSLYWQTIKSFTNDTGSFPWIHEKINITDLVKGHYIRIAFVATGNDDYSFHNWHLDNIIVFRLCNPPRDLHWITAGEHMAWSPPLPHSTKGFTGYNIFSEYNFIEFTTDTFYVFDPPVMSGPIYIDAVYEDCMSSSNAIWGNVGIQETLKPDIKLFPNPASNSINIQSDEIIQEVIISSVNGQELIRKSLGGKDVEINVGDLQNGIYMALVRTETNLIRKKFIIHHP